MFGRRRGRQRSLRSLPQVESRLQRRECAVAAAVSIALALVLMLGMMVAGMAGLHRLGTGAGRENDALLRVHHRHPAAGYGDADGQRACECDQCHGPSGHRPAFKSSKVRFPPIAAQRAEDDNVPEGLVREGRPLRNARNEASLHRRRPQGRGLGELS